MQVKNTQTYSTMQDLKEFVFILLVIAVFIAVIQWLLLRFTHWSVALAATGLISFIIAFIYISLKNATPNGGSNGPELSEYITPTLVAFTVLFCGFLLVSLLTPAKLPKIAYILPITLVAVFAISRFIYQEVENATVYYDLFSDCNLEIVNETNGSSNLHEIGFKNTSNSVVLVMEPNSEEPNISSMLRQADQIFFRSNSSKTDRLFTQEFHFDYSICKEEEKNPTLFFWLKATKVLPIKFVLLPNEKVDLYIGGNFIKQYQLNEE